MNKFRRRSYLIPRLVKIPLLIVFALVLITKGLVELPANLKAEQEPDYVITAYRVEVEVQTNGDWLVSETLKVNFNQPRHGIYFDIPIHRYMTFMIDDQSVSKDYYFPVLNLELSPDGSYERDAENVHVIFGDLDTLVEGPQEYQLSYKIGSTPFLTFDHQLFYLDIIPSGWTTAIENASFQLMFEQPVSLDDLYYYFDSEPADSANKPDLACGLSQDNHIIDCQSLRPLSTGEGITVYQLLPADYYQTKNSAPITSKFVTPEDPDTVEVTGSYTPYGGMSFIPMLFIVFLIIVFTIIRALKTRVRRNTCPNCHRKVLPNETICVNCGSYILRDRK